MVAAPGSAGGLTYGGVCCSPDPRQSRGLHSMLGGAGYGRRGETRRDQPAG